MHQHIEFTLFHTLSVLELLPLDSRERICQKQSNLCDYDCSAVSSFGVLHVNIHSHQGQPAKRTKY